MGCSRRKALQDGLLVRRTGVAQRQPHQKAVELRLGQRKRAFIFNRVLRSQHQKRARQRPRHAIHRHLLLLHGF